MWSGRNPTYLTGGYNPVPNTLYQLLGDHYPFIGFPSFHNIICDTMIRNKSIAEFPPLLVSET